MWELSSVGDVEMRAVFGLNRKAYPYRQLASANTRVVRLAGVVPEGPTAT